MNKIKFFSPVCVVVLLILSADCLAQGARTGSSSKSGLSGSRTSQQKGDDADSKESLRVRKFYAMDKNTYLKSPKYDPTQQPSTTREKEWMQFSVVYDTSAEWIDSAVFQYYVLSEKTVDGKKAYSLFKKTVRYIDIARGRQHMSDVYLHPKAVERYGKVVAAGFEVVIDGKTVAKDSKTEGINFKSVEWWTSIADSDKVTVRDGYLLDRGESPFAMSNIDDYELIKR